MLDPSCHSKVDWPGHRTVHHGGKSPLACPCAYCEVTGLYSSGRYVDGTVEDVRSVYSTGRAARSGTRTAMSVTMHCDYYASVKVSSILHCAPTALQARGNWHGLGGGPGAGLDHVRRVGAVGTACLQHRHVYLARYQRHSFIQSVGQVCIGPVCLPRAISHLAATSAIPGKLTISLDEILEPSGLG